MKALVLILSLLTANVSLIATAHALPWQGDAIEHHSTAHSIGTNKTPRPSSCGD